MRGEVTNHTKTRLHNALCKKLGKAFGELPELSIEAAKRFTAQELVAQRGFGVGSIRYMVTLINAEGMDGDHWYHYGDLKERRNV
jgi:hypothetical protein